MKELLLKIMNTQIDLFYLAMKDTWTREDNQKDTQLTNLLNTLVEEYTTNYGLIPGTKTIDELIEKRNNLKAILNNK